MSEERNLEKAALRGEPSYVWRAGQVRRLEMILRAAGDGHGAADGDIQIGEFLAGQSGGGINRRASFIDDQVLHTWRAAGEVSHQLFGLA